MEIGYARVSTTEQDLERQVHALEQVGIEASRIFVDKKSGTTIERPGLRAARGYARTGDVLVVHTLDRLGRTAGEMSNLVHDPAQRGVGVKNLADPIKVDSSNPSDPMAQLSVVLLALFARLERAAERAAHARSVATAKGRRVGRPAWVDLGRIASVVHVREQGETIAQIAAKTGAARTSLYRHLPPHPAEPLTADSAVPPVGARRKRRAEVSLVARLVCCVRYARTRRFACLPPPRRVIVDRGAEGLHARWQITHCGVA